MSDQRILDRLDQMREALSAIERHRAPLKAAVEPHPA